MRALQGGGADATSLASRVGPAAAVAAAVIVLDQTTKTYAEHHFAVHPVALGPVQLVYLLNSGVAFSLGAGNPLVSGILAAAVAAILAAWGLSRSSRLARLAAGMVVGGAVSNLLDRVVRHHHGAVIDWIRLPLWPVFNLADASITLGIALIVVAELRAGRARG